MKVAIIHPWLPQYRVEFFRRLITSAASHGVDIQVFFGETPPEWQARGDKGVPDGFTKLKTRFITLRGRSLNYKSLKAMGELRQYDLVIVEQAVRNLETYELLLRRRPLAFWGHGRTYTLRVSPIQDRFKQWLARTSSWFFAYTAGGAQSMVAAGMDPRRVTVVQNAIDVQKLHSDVAGVSSETLKEFESRYDLQQRTALFIGGLDSSKRIPFLLESAKIAAGLDPNFRLLIAGDGDDRGIVEEAAAAHSYIIYLGSVFGTEKAQAIAASQVIAMPGRVGLVAVDSFAARRPIVTTDWPYHSVEFEYLIPRVNAIVSNDDQQSFARALVATLQDDVLMDKLRSSCEEAKNIYTLDAMVENFTNGVLLALNQVRA